VLVNAILSRVASSHLRPDRKRRSSTRAVVVDIPRTHPSRNGFRDRFIGGGGGGVCDPAATACIISARYRRETKLTIDGGHGYRVISPSLSETG